MTPTQHYQTMLKAVGVYRGQIDGDFGPLTLAAAMEYHQGAPAWLYVAAQELGVSEILGARANPRIVIYHQSVPLAAKSDEVAWCASFVDWTLNKAAMAGTNSAAAATYDKFGLALDSPRLGAIVTFPTKTGSRRHVAFVAGWTERFIFHLGGNQSNAVNVQYNLRTNIAALRWPTKSLA